MFNKSEMQFKSSNVNYIIKEDLKAIFKSYINNNGKYNKIIYEINWK